MGSGWISYSQVNEDGAAALHCCCSLQIATQRMCSHASSDEDPSPYSCALFIAAIALLVPPGGRALADDLLGMYVGGSVGQSIVRASQLDFLGPYPPNPSPVPVSVSKSATGWKVFAGLRPISLVGAELAYTDFGHPTASQGPPAGFGLADSDTHP
jgi:hypothetical protein